MLQEIRNAMNGTYERRARQNACAGLAVGLLIGAVAGILFAPKPGKETRADIREGAKIGAEKVKETAHHVTDVAKEKYETVKKHVKQSKAADKVAEAAEEIVEELNEESDQS